jgi:hypothetical protein
MKASLAQFHSKIHWCRLQDGLLSLTSALQFLEGIPRCSTHTAGGTAFVASRLRLQALPPSGLRRSCWAGTASPNAPCRLRVEPSILCAAHSSCLIPSTVRFFGRIIDDMTPFQSLVAAVSGWRLHGIGQTAEPPMVGDQD